MNVKYRARDYYPRITITREMIRQNSKLRLFIRLRMLFLVLNPVIAMVGIIIVMTGVF
ncbi:MAG: hypothetical protein KIS30_00060 [Thermoplasmata archaeon]|nr:hypothetical protein [Candidatus Sysuiplasma acidicola]MBX8645142.1 hypothetical protein [Candidatus Sysuiplasma acidicola]MDH2906461.1 hypothetical protein [Methanomassiliicoccales archaeon]